MEPRFRVLLLRQTSTRDSAPLAIVPGGFCTIGTMRYRLTVLENLEEMAWGWTKVSGVVKKILPDLSTKGKDGPHLHQRFIVKLGDPPAPNSQNVEVDHSLLAAPRAPVDPEERILLRGKLEPHAAHYSGPIVHFTHKSRDGSPAGFIRSKDHGWVVQ